jgi:hypothetical protein
MNTMLSKKLFSSNHESDKKIIQQIQYLLERNEMLPIERIDVLKLNILEKTVFKNFQGFVKLIKGR